MPFRVKKWKQQRWCCIDYFLFVFLFMYHLGRCTCRKIKESIYSGRKENSESSQEVEGENLILKSVSFFICFLLLFFACVSRAHALPRKKMKTTTVMLHWLLFVCFFVYFSLKCNFNFNFFYGRQYPSLNQVLYYIIHLLTVCWSNFKINDKRQLKVNNRQV
jgi:hypothetical protein